MTTPIDPFINKQFKMIEATLKNATIEIKLLREENEKLQQMLGFSIKKGELDA